MQTHHLLGIVSWHDDGFLLRDGLVEHGSIWLAVLGLREISQPHIIYLLHVPHYIANANLLSI